MQARSPEELPLVFQHHLNAGDVDGLMRDYYAPSATYSPLPGLVVNDDDIAPTIARLAALGAPIVVSVRHVIVQDDTALIILDFTIAEAGMSGTATDVARRQSDGTWRCIIDNPHGGANTVDLPDATAAALAP